jgi:hypothetical protein
VGEDESRDEEEVQGEQDAKDDQDCVEDHEAVSATCTKAVVLQMSLEASFESAAASRGGSSQRSPFRYDPMPRSALGWTLTIGVPVLAVAIAIVVLGGGTTETDVQAQAAAVCTDAQRALKQLPKSPSSIAEALAIEHRALAIYRREISQLEDLAPHAGESFRAGLADDRSLLTALSSMIARPDFVSLSLSLPGHPNRMPGWLRRWLARSHRLLADAKAQFSRAGIPACEKSLG